MFRKRKRTGVVGIVNMTQVHGLHIKNYEAYLFIQWVYAAKKRRKRRDRRGRRRRRKEVVLAAFWG